jgi:hypothetical protein
LEFWNSLEKIARINDWLLALAAIFALVAAICGGLAWFTGKRVSVLQDAARQSADGSRDTKIKEAQQNADSALAAQKDAENRLKDADNRVKQLENEKQPRTLTDLQKTSFSNFLATQPAYALTINASVNANDSRAYAETLASLLRARGWDVKIANALFMGPNTSGLWITFKNPNKPPVGTAALQHALSAAKIECRSEYDPTLPSPEGDLFLSIGSK